MAVHAALSRKNLLIDLPNEIKQMILCLLDPFTFSVFLEAIPMMRPLARQLKRTKDFKKLPIMAEFLSSTQPVPKPSTRHFRKPLDNVTSCHDGRYLSFKYNVKSYPSGFNRYANHWRSEPASNEPSGTMSVTLWPRRWGQRSFKDVPVLLDPFVLDHGRLCLGYERVQARQWRLVARQISDWSLVAEQPVQDPADLAVALDRDSDLVVQYSLESASIRIWNPRRKKLWKVQHPLATVLHAPHILHGEKGFITTSKGDLSEDFHVLSWRHIVWQDGDQPSYMERHDFSLAPSYLFPNSCDIREIATHTLLDFCTSINETGQNGISFNWPEDSELTMTYTGELLKPDDLERGILDAFSDGTNVIRTDFCCAGSKLYMVKDGRQIWQLEDDRDCCGAMIFLDAYLIVVHRDHGRRLACEVSFLTINGELVCNFVLPWNYNGRETRLFEEEGRVVIFADVLSEATVWTFFDTALSIKRASKRQHPYERQGYELRPRKIPRGYIENPHNTQVIS